MTSSSLAYTVSNVRPRVVLVRRVIAPLEDVGSSDTVSRDLSASPNPFEASRC